MNPFAPQLSQQDLAEMIDRGGVDWEFRHRSWNTWLKGIPSENPKWLIAYGYELRLPDNAPFPKHSESTETTIRATGIEAQVCADITLRQQLGLAKYGTTVADNPLDLLGWLNHAYEETLDQAIYLKRAMVQLSEAVAPKDAGWEKCCEEAQLRQEQLQNAFAPHPWDVHDIITASAQPHPHLPGDAADTSGAPSSMSAPHTSSS